jgi:hypothetical protein
VQLGIPNWDVDGILGDASVDKVEVVGKGSCDGEGVKGMDKMCTGNKMKGSDDGLTWMANALWGAQHLQKHREAGVGMPTVGSRKLGPACEAKYLPIAMECLR